MTPIEPPVYLTPRQYAKLTGVSYPQVLAAIKQSDKLANLRVGWKYPQDEITEALRCRPNGNTRRPVEGEVQGVPQHPGQADRGISQDREGSYRQMQSQVVLIPRANVGSLGGLLRNSH